MLILGIDPGIARTGWGIVEKKGQLLSHLKYGCFETLALEPATERLKAIFNHITHIAKTYQPQAAAVEDLFFNTNAKTAMKVGEARGVILLALEEHHIPIFHYSPLQIKTAITSYGRADKLQVQKMVKSLLRLGTIPKPDDAADALAVALTHAFTVKPEKV